MTRTAWGDGGAFGWWDRDGATGVDVFRVAPSLPDPALVTPPGGASACWHQVANRELTATATVGGGTGVWTARRGVVRLTGDRRAWDVDGLVAASLTATWGPAFAEWQGRTRTGATVVRRVAAPAEDVAALRVDVAVHPAADGGGPAWVAEGLDLAPLPLLVGGLMSPWTAPPAGVRGADRLAWSALFGLAAAARAATHAARRLLARGLVASVDAQDGAVVVRPRRPAPPEAPPRQAWFDRSLPTLVLVAVGDGGAVDRPTVVDRAGRWPSLRVRTDAVEPDAAGVRRLAFVVALGADERAARATAEAAGRTDADALARAWGGLVRLELDRPTAPGRPAPASLSAAGPEPSAGAPPPGAGLAGTELLALTREAPWHAVHLVGAEQPDDWLGVRYPAQGSAYGYVHGLQGAPRDYAISAVPLTFIDPPAARQALVAMARLTRPSGAVAYAHTGRGRTTSGGIHDAPTDLPLFWMWALTEYVWGTGDRAFLDEELPFDPPAAGRATPRERVLVATRYLREEVGAGPHGLLRVGSGDWADPISAMVRDRRAFHRHGESGFNTGFAAFVLPRAADLVADTHPAEAAALRAWAGELSAAMAAAWNGSWFLRGFDGRGAPVGDRHLFLDGQVWCLIAQVGSEAQRRRLVAAIAERNDRPSPVGATILDRPHPVRFGMLAPGWDCNGGVWAAVNGLLAWGYARHDPVLAWRALRQQSLAAHARAYPHVWYGIWSGPDACNAHFGSRPGETFVQPATPMTEFPVMNSNAHAGPLLALLRVLGLETEPSGVVVRPQPPGAPSWRIGCALGEWSSPAG
ncbi:MAG: hypothetical protein R2726_15520 [Acidimicrobiales bacterium]